MDYSLKKKWIKIRIKYKTVQTVDSYTKKKSKTIHTSCICDHHHHHLMSDCITTLTQITEYLLRKKGLNCQINFWTGQDWKPEIRGRLHPVLGTGSCSVCAKTVLGSWKHLNPVSFMPPAKHGFMNQSICEKTPQYLCKKRYRYRNCFWF